MTGALTRPAVIGQTAAIGAANARRLGVAVVVVLGLHLMLLAGRLGPHASAHAAPAVPVMAVRFVSLSRPPPSSAAAAPAMRAEAVKPVASVGPDRTPVEPPQPVREPPPMRRSTGNDKPSLKPDRPAESAPLPMAAAVDAAPVVLALPAAPDYALGARLDPGPRPLDEIEPDYPDTENLREGVVVLRLLISDTGHVDNVAVVRAEPRGVFEQAALDAFSKARFSPGLAAGTPVRSQITVEVQFVPINRGGRVSGRTY
jgi:periplasmic protein TonB